MSRQDWVIAIAMALPLTAVVLLFGAVAWAMA